jgi:phenylpropionate dioxygenase-like ring-hydroxylating dioxygenase large terminal subunit
MPARFYTDAAVFAAEREHIFLQSWLFLCRDDQLAAPGAYRAFETPGGPVVLVRGDDGVLRAFANVCRHRGSLLLEGDGTCRRIVCPYHAWSYDLDGALHAAPDMGQSTGFDRGEHGLIPVRLETWAGFVFVTFNADAAPLLEHLGDLPQRMASHRLEEMVCTWTVTLTPRCNWKVIFENAMETYHTGVVHRTSVGAQQSRFLPTKGEWKCIQVTSGRSIATLPGTPPPFPPIEGLDDDAQQGTYFTVVHPTVQFAVAQDCLWWLNVTPIAPDHSHLEIGGCFPRAVTEQPDFAAKAADYYHRWEVVGREDSGILERQQHALSSVLHRPGRLSWRDDQVHALTGWVLDHLPDDIVASL